MLFLGSEKEFCARNSRGIRQRNLVFRGRKSMHSK